MTLVLALLTTLAVTAQGKPQTHPRLMEAGDSSRLAFKAERDKLICFALYTVQKGVLKTSAQLYPLRDGEEHAVTLEVKRGGEWKQVGREKVHRVGWTATFRVEGWDSSKDTPYRVRHAGGSVYEGTVRRDPVDKDVITAAVFTGNSPGPGGGKISKRDVVDNMLKINPDVLLFTGDQVYNHRQHTQAWLQFGELFRDVIRDRPTVCLPDDHDVGQGNLWGGAGRKVKIDTAGGYTRPAEYVKLVERQQTSHLPDPPDPTPIGQGIGVYFTSLNVGGIDFALIEDRKFKSGCLDFNVKGRKLGPRPDHISKPDYDPKEFDTPDRKLLGDRQIKFLRAWGRDWDGAIMKSVVSQTVFSMASTYHSGRKAFYLADFDANGWPQAGRNRAIDAMRRCFAVHLCGDQHLSTLVQYGIDDWRDSNWAFCVPSIANLWPRWWIKKEKGGNPEPGAQEHTGDYRDGFGNRLTVYAHTNPHKTGREPAALHDRMPGFGITRFNKKERTITMECWPRQIDVTDPKNKDKQYRGWPRTIRQLDNYGRPAKAWLPEIVVSGATDPVVEIVEESTKEVVYVVRIKGTRFRPKVFAEGSYTVRVNGKSFTGVKAANEKAATLEVSF